MYIALAVITAINEIMLGKFIARHFVFLQFVCLLSTFAPILLRFDPKLSTFGCIMHEELLLGAFCACVHFNTNLGLMGHYKCAKMCRTFGMNLGFCFSPLIMPCSLYKGLKSVDLITFCVSNTTTRVTIHMIVVWPRAIYVLLIRTTPSSFCPWSAQIIISCDATLYSNIRVATLEVTTKHRNHQKSQFYCKRDNFGDNRY